jgi:TIR domain/Effector-associated domain 11
MINDFDKLRSLIAENKMDRALVILREKIPAYPDLKNQLFTISAKFTEIRKKENIGLIDESEAMKFHAQVSFSVLELINDMENSNGATPSSMQDILPLPISAQPANDSIKRKSVFISYNHHDLEIANKLKAKLTAENINVVIDSEKMMAGEDIKEFIEKCVRETGTTISLISRSSLLSAWVSMESVNSFYHEKTDTKKKFIACFITDDFFKREFTDEALDHIEGEIKEIQNLIAARMAKNRNIRDLQNELSRMTEMRNNMDEIIRRLRESLCIDIRENDLENNFQKIVHAIHS